jgi:hypothetical protein
MPRTNLLLARYVFDTSIPINSSQKAALLIRVWEVSYADVFAALLSLSKYMLGYCLKTDRRRFLQHPSQTLNRHHPSIRQRTSKATEDE